MAFKYPERDQKLMFPTSIEDYVAEDSPVRAYDAVVDLMDLPEMGIDIDENQVGNSAYDPRSMLKLLVYGYSYGIRSSRKLERAAVNNLSFIWLMGGLQPDHKTISQFRRNNKKALKKALQQIARMCIKLGLISGNTLFVDGTKIRANASNAQTWDSTRCVNELNKIDRRIEKILKECEQADHAEDGSVSQAHLSEELSTEKKLRSKVKQIWRELEESENEQINSTDPDARIMKGTQGSHTSYNVQTVVDEEHGLIVSADAVDQSNDRGQFSAQIKQAEETLGKAPEAACADAGYSSVDDIEKISSDIHVIIPSQRQSSKKKPGPFDREKFRYDTEHDCYICPEGNKLYRTKNTNEKGHIHYRMKSSLTCKGCRHYGQGKCTSGQRGRQISRLRNEALREHLEAVYEQEDSQKIYKRRKERAELPFGHIKHNLGARNLLLRGFDGAKAEVSLLCSSFNIRRMITLLGGVAQVIQAMRYLSGTGTLYRPA